MQISVISLVSASEIGVCGQSLTSDSKTKDIDEEVLKTLDIQHQEHIRLGLNCKMNL